MIRALALALLLLSATDAHADASSGCLAHAMWGEARGEGTVGMLAVADVALNRSERSNQTVCAIVQAPAQFAGYRLGGAPSADVQVLASDALTGRGRGTTGGATYFVERRAHPRWLRRLRFIRQIGRHNFYGDKI